jgi:hypothetical protein
MLSLGDAFTLPRPKFRHKFPGHRFLTRGKKRTKRRLGAKFLYSQPSQTNP